MATTQWIPISPELNEDRSFFAFSNYDNANQLKPLELKTEIMDFNMFRVFQRQIDTNLAVNMGLFSQLGIDLALKSYTFIYEGAVFSDEITSTPIGDLIYGTRYGTGYRIMLKVTNFDSNINLSMGGIAAQSTLGRANVEFEVYGFGFPNNASILFEAPGPADFNVDTWANIKAYETSIREFLKENINGIQPKPYQVLVDIGKLPDPQKDFQSMLFAYKRILKKDSLSETLNRATMNYEKNIIVDVYKQLHFTDENIKPSNSQISTVRNILDV